MDFGLSEDQLLFKDSLRRYLDAECPTARVRAIMEGPDGHDRALWRGLAEMGVTGLMIPPAYGGAGLELLDVALAAEELGRAATPGPFLASAMAAAALIESGNAEAQRRWLPAIASGECVVAFALGEGLGEWDAGKLQTRANGGTLSGEKPVVAAAGVADALVVAAMDADGPGLFVVERAASGLTVSPLAGLDMTRRVDRVVLDGTPAAKIASGRAAIDRARDVGLVLLAADAYGG
ncbi:MAG TPA: acyl-CoA dehydrogenase family protein, partial [Candidatus Limnocylindria bacterium]|nr:acyl-CoA dehydrogenase family protein [Candidatus Limnocylindria bacterium]